VCSTGLGLPATMDQRNYKRQKRAKAGLGFRNEPNKSFYFNKSLANRSQRIRAHGQVAQMWFHAFREKRHPGKACAPVADLAASFTVEGPLPQSLPTVIWRTS
jgi:hypothetical protein